MPLYRIYIGSNNKTKKITAKDETYILKTLSLISPSLTTYRAKGYFKGVEEETLVVSIATQKFSELKETLRIIRKNLKQDGIGLEYNGKYQRITN